VAFGSSDIGGAVGEYGGGKLADSFMASSYDGGADGNGAGSADSDTLLSAGVVSEIPSGQCPAPLPVSGARSVPEKCE
jgi:hypothetical protein